MKTQKKISHYIKWLLLPFAIFLIFSLNSCEDEDLLQQESKSELNAPAVLSTRDGFEIYLTAG
jgi:hypothetical protein